MLIKNSILAGEILNILDNAKRAVSYEELEYYIEQPLHHIQVGVERLIREGLAFFEIEDNAIKVRSIPNLNEPLLVKERLKMSEFAYA